MRAVRLGDENEPDTRWDKFKDSLSRHPWRTVAASVISVLIGASSLWALVDDRPLLPVVVATAKSVFPSGAWSMRNVGVVLALVLIAIGLALPFIVAFAAARYRREVQRLSVDLAEAGTERDRLRSDVVAFKDKMNEYAMECLEAYRSMKFNNNRVPRVTVRYVAYAKADDDLAQRIKGLLTQYVGWQVALDGSNNPALPQADKFKVVFDTGMTLSYGNLFRAFKDADLLGVPVGITELGSRTDTEHLILLVLPTLGDIRASK